tara:strand:+ start:931 stop:1257 length:327 start_codon:yes stop_codon:yes gene_type:complete
MISISKSAKSMLLKTINNDNGNAILLYLKGGGCNGFTYKFKVIKDDSLISNNESLNLDNRKMYLCNSSLMFLIGTDIDYVQDIMGSRFVFTNNKIDTKCGCGTSVNFK